MLTEIVSSDISLKELKDKNIKGIILSGGARSVYDKTSPKIDKKILELGIPILGICYGHQLLAQLVGGEVQKGKVGEYGMVEMVIKNKKGMFAKLEQEQKVWMNHKDIVTKLPEPFLILAGTKHSPITAFISCDGMLSGVQFHPEVTHTENGMKMLGNFVFQICGAKKSYSSKFVIKSLVDEAKEFISNRKAIIGLSGGVDSSAAAALVARAIGKNLTAVYVDTGLMRHRETEFIRSVFKNSELNLKIIKAGNRFFKELKNVCSPEKKRKIVGKVFVDVFYEVAQKEKADVLIQGTIYSDRIESGLTKHSSCIKSHHNVGGLPKNLKMRLYEPLRDLYKDEVRNIARELGLPKEIAERKVFPGPGLAIRILGEVTPEKAKIAREVNHIVEEELKKTKYWKNIWMAFAVLLPIKSVGIQGDQRSYKYPVVIRIIESKDAMTANFSKVSLEILEKISARITNEVREINRVVYDITNKPPATMEWE